MYVEGRPSPSERARQEAETRAARASWKPGAEAFAMLESLRCLVGREVLIQAWDAFMFYIADEGPYPVRGRCLEVVTREDSEGHLRAYLVLENPEFVPTPNGSKAVDLLLRDGDRWLFGLHDIYELEAPDDTRRSRPTTRILSSSG